MAESTFRGIIDFFGELGIYDVILPFLLVFTIVFAILEKTQILGAEKSGDDTGTRKNLNAMVAFVVAFLVVASAGLVRAINEAMANIVMLLLLSIGFMILVGSFHQQKEFYLEKTWKNIFMVIMFVGIVLVFLAALGWLEPSWEFMKNQWDDTIVSSIILLVVVGGFVYFIVKPEGNGNGKNKG